MTTFFGREVADDILGKANTYSSSMPTTNKEASFFSTLANTYEANPQDTMAPPSPPTRKPKQSPAWFGPNLILENIETVTIGSTHLSSQLTSNEATKISELESKINNLANENAKLNQTVSNIIDQKLSPVHDSIRNVSTSLEKLQTTMVDTRKSNTIKFNTIVSDVGYAITQVRKRERGVVQRAIRISLF